MVGLQNRVVKVRKYSTTPFTQNASRVLQRKIDSEVGCGVFCFKASTSATLLSSVLYFLAPGDVWTLQLHARRNECVRLRRTQGPGVCEGEDVSTEEREEENLFTRNGSYRRVWCCCGQYVNICLC